MDYDNLDAGREMDALIAEKVMGTPKGDRPGEWLNEKGNWLCDTDELPPYSTSISAAWEVVEKLNKHCFHIMRFTFGEKEGVALESVWYRATFDYSEKIFVEAPSAPLAICRSALKAVEE